MDNVLYLKDKLLYENMDKNVIKGNYVKQMLDRTNAMFKYSGLPEEIPEKIFELMLQTNGYLIFTKFNDKFYVFWGGLGGKPDAYYQPTKCVVSNPSLNLSKEYTLNDDCVLIRNDINMIGLLPIFNRYADLTTESEISLNVGIINSRIISIITSSDDNTKMSANKFLSDVYDGKLGIITDNNFLDDNSLKTLPYSSSTGGNYLSQLIEVTQYVKASCFNEIGVNANYNMKRESINSNESDMNNDSLLPFIDNMLECRRDSIDKINKMYDLNIKVELNSSWNKNHDNFNGNDNIKNNMESDNNVL